MKKECYLFAKNDIYDEENKERIYLKDELIGSISILKETKEVEMLPKGVYYVQNDNHMLSQDIYIEERLESWQYFENVLLMRNTISIDLKVIDNQRNMMIQGVHCGLFAARDIYDKNDCLVYFKDDLILDVLTQDDYWKVPLLNINEGTFYIQQIDALEGYLGYPEPVYLNVNFNKGFVDFSVLIENQPTIVEILKVDECHQFVKGAWLVLENEKGELVDEWISEQEHRVYGLVIGERYVLKEKETPEGYIASQEVFFIVKNSTSIQTITMINQRKIEN